MSTEFPTYDCRYQKMSSSRRDWIGGTMSGFFSFALANSGTALLAASPAKTKKLLVIWAGGGPSQFETFDPKPGQNTGGGTRSIETAVPGIRIAENLPLIAGQMDKLSVVRNVTSTEGEHQRATYYLHTGYPFVEAFPRPSMGAVASSQSPESALPGYVSIGNPGFGPAYLGADNGPFSIESAGKARRLLRTLESRRRRIELTRKLSESFGAQRLESTALEARLAVLERIGSLIDTPFAKALDIENDASREKYGRGQFAERAVLARRLLEIGVPFVELHHQGWDTHANNAANTRRLCGQIDHPWSVLMEELSSGGLLDETIVIWMGEFGRTPAINATEGRDHFPAVVPVVIGGGGIPGGQLVGATNADGTGIAGKSHQVADLFATVFRQIGVDPNREFPTDFGSMTTATDRGRPIAELM